MNEITTTGINKNMSTLEIAELTGKQHKNVMRDVRSLLKQGAIGGQFLVQSSYTDAQNKHQPMYVFDSKTAGTIIRRYNMRGKQTKSTIVYIMKAGGFYKIGITANVRYRMKQCQTGNPIKIKLIFSENVAKPRTVEAILHSACKDKRMRGEWFTLSKKDVDSVIAIIKENKA